jgi:tripartite-type tricarboxylate transporter receptor subunit TctC
MPAPKTLLIRGLAACTLLLAHVAGAQTWPERVITLIVPFAPGASADGIARIVGRELSTAVAQPVIVDNRPGGGGSTGLLAVAKAAPDGYTIGLGATGAIAVNPHLPDAAPLKPQKDLVPIAKLADIPLVFVANAKAGYASLPDLVARSKTSAEGINYGTTGQYTSQHLAGELLTEVAHAHLVAVPYRGSGPAVNDLLGGQIGVAVVDLTSAAPHVKAGTLKALAVTSTDRSKVAPDIPTVAEQGFGGYSASGWMGLFAPARTPAPVVERLSKAVQAILARPEIQQQIVALAAEPAYLDAPAFGRFVDGESTKWAQVIASTVAKK